MKDRVTPIAVIVFVVLCGYVGSYYAMVEPGTTYWANSDPNDISAISYAQYPIGGRAAEIIFWPAYRVDVWLRPSMWKTDFGLDSHQCGGIPYERANC